MEIDPQRLFRFRFKSPGMSDDMSHYVLTDDIEKMRLFLAQHNFNPTDSFIDCVMFKDFESDTEYMLEPFILKSNYSPKIFTIMSTEHMIYECANEVASIMSQSLIFGPHIIREDIPIMKIISELVNEYWIIRYAMQQQENHFHQHMNSTQKSDILLLNMPTDCLLQMNHHHMMIQHCMNQS